MVTFGWVAMLTDIMTTIALLSGVLVLYHHAGYPLLLRWLAARRPVPVAKIATRGFKSGQQDDGLPKISLLMPAHNEAEVIAEKIRNLGALDYPADRLQVILVCDGCSDATAAIARKTHLEPESAHLDLLVVEQLSNRGKLRIINEWVPKVDGSLIALSDVSALLSVDALLAVVAHFADPEIGVVCGKYQLLHPGSIGEQVYWNYQTAIKQRESALGSIMGVHGAFYVFRSVLFVSLAGDTINDDFILPMEIVAAGYRAIYEPRIHALELEEAANSTDWQRRRRIAAGNLQQTLRLRKLLKYRFGATFFNFASGKALRAFMPFILLVLFLSSGWVSLSNAWFAALFAAQCLVYGVAWYRHLNLEAPAAAVVQTIYYLVSGHVNGFIGATRYIMGRERGNWRRVVAKKE